MGDTFNIPFRNSMKVPLQDNWLTRQNIDEKIAQNTKYHNKFPLNSKGSVLPCLTRCIFSVLSSCTSHITQTVRTAGPAALLISGKHCAAEFQTWQGNTPTSKLNLLPSDIKMLSQYYKPCAPAGSLSLYAWMELCFTHTVLLPRQKLLIFLLSSLSWALHPSMENMATLSCLCARTSSLAV